MATVLAALKLRLATLKTALKKLATLPFAALKLATFAVALKLAACGIWQRKLV